MYKSWVTDAQSIIVVSDIHAGRQNRWIRDRTLRALNRIVEHANAQKTGQIIINGDLLDERATWKRVQEDVADIRSVLDGFHGGWQNIRFIYGNHDMAAGRKLLDTELHDILGDCRIEEDWIVFDPPSGVTCTHGHIFGTLYARRALLELARQDEGGAMEELYMSEGFQRKMHGLHVRYVAVASAGKWLGRMGIPLERAWEILRSHGHVARANIAAYLRDSNPDGLGQHFARYIDLSSHVLAAELGTTMGGWCAVVGHTHAPAAIKRMVLRKRSHQLPHIVGNAGSFVSKAGFPATFVEAKFPSMTLWAYDTKTDSLQERRCETLTEQEQQTFLR